MCTQTYKWAKLEISWLTFRKKTYLWIRYYNISLLFYKEQLEWLKLLAQKTKVLFFEKPAWGSIPSGLNRHFVIFFPWFQVLHDWANRLSLRSMWLCFHFWFVELYKWSTVVLVLQRTGLSPAAAAAKLLQSCPTLCDPIDSSPPGSSVPGILQARIPEWDAISFNAWEWKVKVKSLSRVQLFMTPWTIAYQAPPSMGFSRQEYWSGLPFPSSENLPNPGIESGPSAL